MAASRPGHNYSNIYNSDASRSHLGDVYNQYGPSPDQQAFRAVIDSLRYDGMDDRMDRLSSAERGTFEWALAGRDGEFTVDRHNGNEDYGQEDTGDNASCDEGGDRGIGSDDGGGSTDNEGEDDEQEDNEHRDENDEHGRTSDEDGESTDNEDGEEPTDSEDYEGSSDENDFWHNTRSIDEIFTDWLISEEEGGNLFCFMGKPGSGKSTLMYEHFQNKTTSVFCTDLRKLYRKYLSTNAKIEQFLEVWTKGKDLIRAEHFFWILGDTVQKSREGLLRHFLYSALLSLPANDLDLAKRVCGPRRLLTSSQRAWSYEELYDMLVRLVTCSKARFFFLVDALDECDPQDRHGELAEEMTKISQLPNVKLCVSCRPWKPFASQFRHDGILHLDDMTYEDMKIYLRNRLANADGENDLCSEFRSTSTTERAARFVADIADAAEGVFLWTELVVKALRSELRKGCDFGHLQKTRSEFPIGLDEYFQKLVFDRITRTRQNTSDTAAALMLALKIAEDRKIFVAPPSPHPYSFFNFWLLATGQLTAGFSWADHGEQYYTREDFNQMIKLTSKFVHETCNDLLVVVERTDSRLSSDVQFLHRTVFDFLHDSHLRLVIEQQSPDHFKDLDFLVGLGKWRSVGLLSKSWLNCGDAEDTFACAIEWSPSRQPDDAWLSRCETLMIDVH